jgi:hypothetical protein
MQSCVPFLIELLVSISSHFEHFTFVISHSSSWCCVRSILEKGLPQSEQSNYSKGQWTSRCSLSAAWLYLFWWLHPFGQFLSLHSHSFCKWSSSWSYFRSAWQPTIWFGHLNSSWLSIVLYSLWILPGLELNFSLHVLSRHCMLVCRAHL